MAMVYSGYDKALVDGGGFTLGFLSNRKEQVGIGLGNQVVERTVQNIDEMEFQFPPKILSDNRRGNWQESEARGVEPFSAFKTSGPREFSINATYMVDNGYWTIDKIHKQITLARGYFARVNLRNSTENLVVVLKMWAIGGKDTITARIKAVNVKHSETLIGPSDRAYPLRTDITLDMALWTRGATVKNGFIEIGNETINIKDLRENQPVDWY